MTVTSSRSSRQTRPPRAPVAADARRARWAVSLIFFLNGASFCAILPRYPQLVESIGLSNGSFGLAVGLGPIGGLAAGLLAAPLMARFGSARVAVAFQVVASTVHLLVYTSATWLWLAAALFLAAASDSITDVSMNAHGMRVERRYRRSILNSYHGWWSLGAVTGGILGSVCAQLEVPLWIQGLVGLVLFGSLALGSRRFLLTGHDSTERRPAALEAGLAAPSAASAAAPAAATEEALVGETAGATSGAAGTSGDDATAGTGATTAGGVTRASTLRGLLLIAALGLVLVFAGATEDAGNTWGALFMRDTFAATPFLAGLAFVALQGTQTVGRFLGDGIVDRLGDRLTARIGALLSGAGMAMALIFPHPATALIGFACAGWGIATLFPAAFRAADEMEGVPHGLGITVLGWFARIGFFVTPPIVGALADALTLRFALWLVPLYALGILVFSGVLSARPAPTTEAEAQS
ncbi:MFS transporter [Brachybacterium halotolerans]|uniref:MFS transporter n=1 Tax=Brachybacterium halotolerans TaxID=2795215 RepID=UPI0031B575E7